MVNHTSELPLHNDASLWHPKCAFTFFWLVSLLIAQNLAAEIEELSLSYRLGDNPKWSEQDFDDGQWIDYKDRQAFDEAPEASKRTCWIQFHYEITAPIGLNSEGLLFLSVGGEYNAYLNGRFLGFSRGLANPDALEIKRQGAYNNHFALHENESEVGAYTLALRMEQAKSLPSINIRIEPDRFLTYGAAYFKTGHDESWSALNLNTTDWVALSDRTIDTVRKNGIPNEYWVRQDIYLTSLREPIVPHFFKVYFPASYDFYWDGTLIGSNGKPGDSIKTEIPGKIEQSFTIPGRLKSPGPHQLAYRVSINYERANRWGYEQVLPWFSFQQLRGSMRSTATSSLINGLAFATMTLLGAFYLLAFSLYRRSTEYLTFSLICFCMAAATAFYQNFFDRSNYHQVWWSNEAIHIIGCILGILYPLFHLSRLQAKLKTTVFVLSGLSLVYLIAYLVEPIVGWHLHVVFHGATWTAMILNVLTIARFRRIQDWLILHGGFCLVAAFLNSYDNIPNFFNTWLGIGFSFNLLFLLASLAFQMRDENREKKRALIKTAQLDAQKQRLELELLKSSIQPHFLMNTLTSVMECVEATPEKSIQFIDSLAREYRLLYDVASKSTIPLSKELELCHSFLEIMRFRKDIDYRLNIRNIDLDSEIPPLVLHTLFENSITHNLYEEGQEVVFDLNMSDDGEKRRITFHAPTTNHSAKTRAAGNGMGLKYVRARLEESYPEAWSLSETQTPSHWVTTIEITKRPKPQ